MCIPITTVKTRIPKISSTTAAAKVVIPSGVSKTRISPNTLTDIPIDVAVKIVPIKRAFGSLNPSANPNKTVTDEPKAKGIMTPPIATTKAGFAYFIN